MSAPRARQRARACWGAAAVAAAIVAGALGGARPAAAQVMPPRPGAAVQSQRPDTGVRGRGADTSRKGPTVSWAPLDSVGLALLKPLGVTAVRYQASVAEYRARDGVMVLYGVKGARAAVQREPTSLVADTIEFIERADSVRARGDTIVMHDPAKGDDFTALGRLAYDLARREGSATNVSSSAKSGEVWYVEAHRAAFAGGDSAAKKDNVFYGASGQITSCQDSVPHYHFSASELKRVSNDVVVARNVVMHIQGVPVMWLPFIFQDARTGRRSGILTPRFGLTELVRNSPLYRRTIENVGYYVALNDYIDAAGSLDWRSSATATDADPGWTRWNGEMRYRWLDRFVSGRVAASVHALSNGTSNTQLSWSHSQDFSIRSRLTANVNLSTSTAVQRQTALAPLASLATIASQVNYDREIGPLKLSIGGTRRQYPGRPQVDEDYPTVSLTGKPISVGSWFTWTPGLSASSSASRHLDSQGDFSRRYVARPDGTLDSVKVDRGTHSRSLNITSPIKIFDFQIQFAIHATDRGNDYPELRTVIDPVDTSKKSVRVYERTWLSQVDADLNMNLPQFFGGTWNLVPSITMSNVGPGALLVRTERTGGEWVSQGKRLSYGLGVSPTFFALYPGLGPVSAIRHSVTTSFSYSYSPKASIDPRYLAALGQTQVGFLGANAQNRVTLSVQQAFEAKMGSSDSLNPEGGRKIKLLSLNFSPLTWDFERARATKGKSGFATDALDVSVRSDLLPGFDVGVNYSLFQGSVLSDSAVFSPYLQSVRAGLSIGAGSGIGALFGRLFGGPVTETPSDTAGQPPGGTGRGMPGGAGRAGALAGAMAGGAGQSLRGSALDLPSGRGFEAQLSFSLNQQRAPKGGRVVDYDPTLQCAAFKDLNPLQYDLCVRNALAAPPADVNSTQTTAGGTFFRVPPQANMQFRTGFNLTPKWAASWSTNYDFQRNEFGMQSVTLQRELHDWRAVFGFTQAPNGAFTFTFFVALKAEPDLKFDYNKSTYPGQALPTSR